MPRLDDYLSALLAVDDDAAAANLNDEIDAGGDAFVSFLVDHGLGPLWHERTGQPELLSSRMTAEALYVAQEAALREIDEFLQGSGVDYALIKGAANRLVLYETPALRACYDLDLLVRPQDRVAAATALVKAGFEARPERRNISRQLVLTRGGVDIDLHWGLLREGRLRTDETDGMLDRRIRSHELSMLSADDTMFLLLVHPAFAKHLAGYGMGMHRVADIFLWLSTQAFDWPTVRAQLDRTGVRSAAWATLRWVQLLTPRNPPEPLDEMLADLRPGAFRRAWLERWLVRDWSERTAGMHWLRLAAFSPFLHDTVIDALRAVRGRVGAHRRSDADLAKFGELIE
jgi:hypothetical protein